MNLMAASQAPQRGTQGDGAPRPHVVRVRIPSQVLRRGIRHVGNAGSPPSDGLASGGSDGSHPLRHRVIGIGGEEVQVALQRVALQGRDVGLVRVKIADWPRAERGRLLRLRPAGGGASGALSKKT